MRVAILSLPAEMNDAQKHCVASALIARQCSVAEAAMAGIGKELKDAVTAGDASWADWRSDRKGMRCARNAQDEESLRSCCAGR